MIVGSSLFPFLEKEGREPRGEEIPAMTRDPPAYGKNLNPSMV
jgi:hypothetical protein